MYIESKNLLNNYIKENYSYLKDRQLMILMGEDSSNELKEITKILNDYKIQFFGGIFPMLLVGDLEKKNGFIVESLSAKYCKLTLPHMFKIAPEVLESKNGTAIILADGLSSVLNDIINPIYKKCKSNFKYIGGGCGFYNLKHNACIFDNNGLYKDVAYVCIIDNESFISVEHGWNALKGPFYVKKAIDNKLITLDNERAFDVYKAVIEEFENITISKEDFFALAKDHPFGILQKDNSFIVRDPVALDDEENIILVANVEEDSDVFVLKGDKKSLLLSSQKVAENCAINQPENYFSLFFDCISRKMFLEDDFKIELANIQQKMNKPLQGALSIGEFSSTKEGNLVIHNKSSILGLVSY
jgi:hypothetical protein